LKVYFKVPNKPSEAVDIENESLLADLTGYLGMEVGLVKAIAMSRGLEVRVCSVDGSYYVLEQDGNPDRLNVSLVTKRDDMGLLLVVTEAWRG
jgi:hypothetical protein